MLSHLSLGTNDADRAAAFYDPVLAVLGIRKIGERDSRCRQKARGSARLTGQEVPDGVLFLDAARR